MSSGPTPKQIIGIVPGRRESFQGREAEIRDRVLDSVKEALAGESGQLCREWAMNVVERVRAALKSQVSVTGQKGS